MTAEDVRKRELAEQQRLRDKWNESYAVVIEDDRPKTTMGCISQLGPSRKPLLEATPAALDYAMAHNYTIIIRGGLYR